MKCSSVDVGMAMANCTATIRVTGEERLRARLWLATQIVRVGLWIAGYTRPIVIESMEKE